MNVNWKMLAEARGIALSTGDAERITPVLNALEEAFRPLTSQLRHETEPAIILSDAAVAGE